MNHNKRIFALGFFDGVHRGHREILGRCMDLALENGCGTAAITFDRHPQSLLCSEPPKLLTTLEGRKSYLRHYWMDEVVVLPVCQEVMSTPWQDFLEQLLAMGAAGFVCGEDFRFGHRGEGDADKLRRFCADRELPFYIVPEQCLDGIRISSTHIRGLIEAGRMEEARHFLGHPHSLLGQVVSGRHLGHQLGFPTANIEIPENVVCPRRGVYACVACVEDVPPNYWAVTNIGSRPTVNGHQVRAESWLLDFDGDLYGKQVELFFCSFLRPEERFESLDTLKAAVLKDAENTRKFFLKR